MDVQLIHKRLRGLALKRAGFALCVHGEAGIGKTHAVSHLLRDAQCASLSLHATTATSAVLQSIPKAQRLPAWTLAITAKLERGEFVEDSALIDAIQATLQMSAPFILHLEDIHEVSPARLEWLGKLADGVKRGRGVALIVTSRQAPPESFEAVQLEPLTLDETRALLEGEIGAPLPQEALRWIHGRAAGNPLYTLEFFRFLARQGFVWNDGRRWHWRKPDREIMPVTVEALIERILTIATDTPVLRDVLGAKAVLPVGSGEALWATVSGHALEVVQLAELELERCGVLVRGEFAHPLYREVQHQGVSVEQQRVFVRRAIQALEQNPENVADFLEEADLDPVETFALLERAAASASRRGDERQSARWMARAVMVHRRETDISLALETAEQLRDSDPIIATQLIEWVLEIKPSEARALFLLAILFAQQMQFDRAQAVLDGIPEDLKNTPEGSETIWAVLAYTDRFDLVLERWRADQSTLPNPCVAGFIMKALTEQGMTEEAIAIGTRALEDERLTGWRRVQAMAGLAFAHRQSNHYDRSEQLNTELLELLIREHHSRRIYVIYQSRANNRRYLGQIRAAFNDAESALHNASEAGDAFHVGIALSLLGDLSVESGEYARAEERLIQALSILEQRDVSFSLVELEASLSLLYTAWPNLPHGGVLSIKYARSALRHARRLHSTTTLIWGLFYAALAEAVHGQPQEALELIRELEALAAQTGPGYSYHASWARAHALEKLGRVPDALAAFREASEQAARVGDLIEANTIGIEVARLVHDLESARTHLCWFEERNLMNGANIVRRYFPKLNGDEPQPVLAALEGQNGLHLECLGSIQFSSQDKSEPMRGRKRQELLAALLETRIAGKSEITRLELIDALYPEDDEDRATSSLKELVRSTRASLGTQAIRTTANGYALGAVNSDAEEFLKTGNTALWRGPYLNGLASRDDAVRESLHLVLSLQAEVRLETDPKEAARVGRLLLEHDPYNLSYLRLTVSALRASDNHKSLNRLYSEARDRMMEVGEVLPQRWHDFLLNGATA